MIRPEILKILCCPETWQPLRLADEATVTKLNQAIAGGQLKARNGKNVLEKIEGALIREDNRVAYVIRHKIPVLLIDEGVVIEELK